MKTVITGIALAAATLVSGAALAQDVKGPKVSWNFSVWGNSRAFTRGIELISKEAARRTGGNFTIKIAYANQLSPERENLDSIKIGAIEGAMFCSSYHPAKNPGLTGLDLPFLPLNNLDIGQTVYEAYYQHPFIRAEMAKWNAVLIMGALLPQFEFMGVGDPLLKLEDWKGKRVRALGGLGEAMRAIGASPTTTTASEVYTSLDRGTVVAASFPFSYAHAAFKLHEISKWYTENLSPGAVNCPTVFSQTAWDKLPPQYRQLIADLKPAAYDALKNAYKAADEKNIPMFKKKLIAVRYSEAELDRFRALGGKPVWDKWIRENSEKRADDDGCHNLIL
ncbi:MAG: TRAP transporter substrate-binding protein DctP, partial [Proteobacteria bacterium]|nr:TRAP transporter substrate-binding protein DctP [Pseudomonadota bacterium]